MSPDPDPYGAVVSWVDRPPVPGPLAGLRVGVKDLIAVAGVPRLCGAPRMVDPTPQVRDATVVARLAQAGAHIVATTTTHEFGWGVITPDTRNPRAPDRIAGGSSGGSAAALAAGLVDGALGSDTAGSIRIPAACCGVVGLRPTHRALPLDGVQPLAPSFDTVGPMARDVATVVRLWDALTGQAAAAHTTSPLRMATVPAVLDGPLDAEVRAALAATLDGLPAGVRGPRLALPDLAEAHTATMTILAAEEIQVHGRTLSAHGDQLSEGVRAALERSRSLSPDAVLQARRQAALARDRMTGLFAEVDVLILPVLPCRVPAVDARTVDVDGHAEQVATALTRLSTPWSLTGLPAGAVPVATDTGGAPIAMQVVGRWGAEDQVLAAMALLERVAGGPWPAVSR